MLALQQKWIKPEERLLFLDLSQFIYLTTILTLYENYMKIQGFEITMWRVLALC